MTLAAAATTTTTSLVFATSVLHHSFGFLKHHWFVEASLSALLSTLLLWQISTVTIGTSLATTDQSLILLPSLPWWRYLSHLFAKSWPPVILSCLSAKQRANHVLVQGGPLGKHCAKICDIVTGLLLWNVATRLSTKHRKTHHELAPTFCSFQKPEISVTTASALVIFTGLVNVVLQFWSSLTQSQGNHRNLQAMVQQQHSTTTSRGLSLRKKIVWFVWAFINAICEEVASRGLWRSAFAMALQQEAILPNNNINNITKSQVLLWSNLLQALVFGLWHYEGIPSGWTGVSLTTVYGGILGWLADQTGGSLWLPILTHTMADYHIFTIIVQPKI